jgi:hypothetical protein
MIIKKLEPTGDLCIKFTEEELNNLEIKQGDKFSFKEENGGIMLQKFSTIDIDFSDLNRDTLEYLISESCKKDVSVNEIISDILECFIGDKGKSRVF